MSYDFPDTLLDPGNIITKKIQKMFQDSYSLTWALYMEEV